MLSVQRITLLCEELGMDLRAGEGSRHHVIDAATALLLAVSALKRAVGKQQIPTHVADAVTADLERARTVLLGIKAVAHAAAEDELRRDVLEARGLVLAATSTLLAVTR